jgi:Protein of unknown function (DUF1553)
LLNDPFVRQQAQALANRVLRADLDDAARITLAYRLTLSRPATAKEIERARAYIADYAAETTRAEAWGSFCQAILASAEFRFLK